MSEVKEKILSESEAMFMRYGFKSITMDDVARELGVSKKTLYQFFVDKNDLVAQCVENHLDKIREGCIFINTHATDPVSEMLEISSHVGQQIKHVNPAALFDLRKYFKPVWDKLDDFRKQYITQNITRNLESGKKKGFYWKDIDTELTCKLYVYLLDFVLNPDNYYDKADFRSVHLELIKYHLRSVCTPKGLEVMENKLSQKQ